MCVAQLGDMYSSVSISDNKPRSVCLLLHSLRSHPVVLIERFPAFHPAFGAQVPMVSDRVFHPI